MTVRVFHADALETSVFTLDESAFSRALLFLLLEKYPRIIEQMERKDKSRSTPVVLQHDEVLYIV
jgi:hypothetical protein